MSQYTKYPPAAAAASTGATWLTPAQGLQMSEHWISSTPAGANNWAFANVATYGAPETLHPGIIDFQSGAAGSTAYIFMDFNVVELLGGGVCTWEAMVKIPTLSTGVETYVLKVGLGDSITTAEANDGVYFRYTDGVNGGRWEARTRKGGATGTTVDTGVTAVTGWTKLSAVVNAAATSAAYYINGVLVATITTDIPTAGPYYTGPFIVMNKTLGASSRDIYADYFFLQIVF